MKPNRRHFIKQTGTLLACMGINELARAGGSAEELPYRMPAQQPRGSDDEKYWELVRQQFPLTKDWAYLNTGTMGASPYPVIEAVRKGMMDGDQYGNYGGWEHTSGKLAKFTGANEDEIALTHNVTEGINIMCWGLPLKKGDEVIVTTHEHVGNALPWLNRQKLDGIVLRTFTPAATADETLNRIAALINKKTRAIAVPHIPCTQGQVLPAKEISRLGKEKGLFVVLDGAHGPGMLMLDLHDIGCDAYASCSHKWMLGPKGTGFLYVRKDFQDTLQTYFVGGGSDDSKWNMAIAHPQIGAYASSAHRYYGGSQNIGLYKGVEAAIDFIDSIGLQHIHDRISMLGAYIQQQLLSLGDKIELMTPVEERSRAGMTGFRIKGVSSEKFYSAMLDQRIRIRMVAENSLNSLRVSTHIYNTKAEIDKLVEEVRKVS